MLMRNFSSGRITTSSFNAHDIFRTPLWLLTPAILPASVPTTRMQVGMDTEMHYSPNDKIVTMPLKTSPSCHQFVAGRHTSSDAFPTLRE
jgi:hypothetical protein